MFGFYVILTLAFLYIAFIGGVIGYLIGKYWKKKQRMEKQITIAQKNITNSLICTQKEMNFPKRQN